MKKTNSLLYLVFILSLSLLFSCKKEETLPYAHLLGIWKGIETYQYFSNDSLETTIRYNLNLEFYADGTGITIDNKNSIDSLVWSYNDKLKKINITEKNVLPPVVNYRNYPFSIIENTDKSQKWSYFLTFLSSGKIIKIVYTWDINKK